MERSRGIVLLAVTLLVCGVLAGACAAPVPTGPGPSAGLPSTGAPTGDLPAGSPGPGDTALPGPTPSNAETASTAPTALSPAPPTTTITLAPGGRLAIRFSGTAGTQFVGLATGRFDDGAVASIDASGVLRERPVTQPMGETMVALRVTGTIQSGAGTYRVEILGGHLEGGIFVEDRVLAMDEATGQGGEVRVDYGNVDL